MNVTDFAQSLDDLKQKKQCRSLRSLSSQGPFVRLNNCPPSMINTPLMINISSNDYLAIGGNSELQADFLETIYQLPLHDRPKFGACSSRLLTGNHHYLESLERQLTKAYQHDRQALVFNSGYHCNLGILPAIAVLPSQTGDTLILADKWVHASMIDGIRLATLSSRCDYKRYRHNDYQHLQEMIDRHSEASRIIIVTESIFSMDGDLADLAKLVAIKHADDRIELYLDEAHSVGIMGQQGLGLAEQTKTIEHIDYLVGTFGKAFASMGAYVICHGLVKDWLINRMRPLIYSTALPPITHAWNGFIFQKVQQWHEQRGYLKNISQQVRHTIENITEEKNSSQSPIIPYIVHSNEKAINLANRLQQAGFYALPIRPPTVPENTARIRLVMNAGIDEDQCDRLKQALKANHIRR